MKDDEKNNYNVSGSFKSGFDLMLILCAVAIVSAVMVRRFAPTT
ncbi:hypothetical protein [Mucilaginibacter sp.]